VRTNSYINLLAVLVVIAVTLILIKGFRIRRLNAVMVAIKVAAWCSSSSSAPSSLTRPIGSRSRRTLDGPYLLRHPGPRQRIRCSSATRAA